MDCVELGSFCFGPVAHHGRRTGNGGKRPHWVGRTNSSVLRDGDLPFGPILFGRVGCDEARVSEIYLEPNRSGGWAVEIVSGTKWWVELVFDQQALRKRGL